MKEKTEKTSEKKEWKTPVLFSLSIDKTKADVGGDQFDLDGFEFES